jgi:hypothetical protein
LRGRNTMVAAKGKTFSRAGLAPGIATWRFFRKSL